MNYDSHSIILTKEHRQYEFHNHLRLIRTLDNFHDTDVFSIFLTTESAFGKEEEFIYDISRDWEKAKTFFEFLEKENVTALTLRDVAENFLASLD